MITKFVTYYLDNKIEKIVIIYSIYFNGAKFKVNSKDVTCK